MRISRRRLCLLLMMGIAIVAGCVPVLRTRSREAASIDVEYWPSASWRVSTPEEQGMDSDQLSAMLMRIEEQNFDIDSVTIIRNGYLVVDVSVHPYHSTRKHNIFSVTKSVVSALIGIAMDQGYIEGVDQPVLSFFPQRTVANIDEAKQAMTLEHLLTMTSGFDCRDSYLYRWIGLEQMRRSEDWVQFALDLPMKGEPGSEFEYCNTASFLLSAIIQETTGMSAYAFAEENLFLPLGISDVAWSSSPDGITVGYSELRLMPHDMAKFGYLYLREGRWEDEQVVSPGWVRASRDEYISASLEDGYGYQWWIDDSGMYMALGYGGQFIFVLPEQEMVVVFTSSLEERDFYVPQRLLNEFIIPAVIASTPLPDNPIGFGKLESFVDQLGDP